jgi:hypothetical protein
VPAAENVAVVSAAFGEPNVTVPGPLSRDHAIVRVPDGWPSSVTVPSRVAWAGKVIVWSEPAFTTGGVFAGGEPPGARISNSLPSFSLGLDPLSTARSTM